jgi:hypothetical protein
MKVSFFDVFARKVMASLEWDRKLESPARNMWMEPSSSMDEWLEGNSAWIDARAAAMDPESESESESYATDEDDVAAALAFAVLPLFLPVLPLVS